MKMLEDRRQKTEEREVKKDNRGSLGIFLLLCVLFVIVTSCQDVKKPEKPQNLIPQETMANILTDIYISNAARSVNNRLLKEYNIKLDSVIYEKYEIDSLQFVESNAFYSSNIKTYTKIISSIEERLKLLQEEKDSIYEIIKKERGDTISGKEKIKEGLLINPVKNGIN